MTNPERSARQEIDRLLVLAGWQVQDVAGANLHAAPGVAIREFPLSTGHGFADYLLYIDGRACGAIEAERQGATLTGVEVQSARYAQGLPAALPAWRRPLPFAYESTGIETHFTNGLDPVPRARNVFAFHRPELLAHWLKLLPTATVLSTGRRLEEVCDVISGFAFKSADFVNDGVPVVKVANVGYGKFISKDQEYLPFDFEIRYRDFSTRPGDLLVALTRPITANTLKVCAYPVGAPAALLNQRVALLRAATPVDARYLLSLMHSPQFKRQVLDAVSQTLQPNLSPVDLRRFEIYWPPVDERASIVAEVDRRLSIVREVEAEVDANLKRAQFLRQAVLHKAFGG